MTRALTLASFGRWDAVAKLKKRGETAAKKDAKGDDFRDSARGVRYLDTWQVLTLLIEHRGLPQSSEHWLPPVEIDNVLFMVRPGGELRLDAAIRHELEYEASWSISLDHLHWLRILYWREGTSGLTPREVVLTSYFVLAGDRRNGKTQVRTCPPTMEAELEALRVRIGYEPPPKPRQRSMPVVAARPPKPKKLTQKQLEEKAAWDAARETAKPYSRLEHYVVGGSLMHPKFGLGRVQRRVTPDTVEVLFENGVPRTLGHRA